MKNSSSLTFESIYPIPRGFPVVSMGKNLTAYVGNMFLEGPLEKETPTHSSVLAWETPRTEEPGGLPSIGLQRAGQGLETEHKEHGPISTPFLVCIVICLSNVSSYNNNQLYAHFLIVTYRKHTMYILFHFLIFLCSLNHIT